MKRLFLLFALLFAMPLFAQKTPSNPLGGNLTVQDAGTCSTTGSFLWQQLPANAATTTVNLAGTFSGTLTIRLSNNGGSSWTTNSTTTSAGTTSISTNGFTDICADVTTFTSGSFAVSLSTGLNTGPQGPPGPAGSSGGSSLATANSGLKGSNVVYPNAPPYNISFDGQVCIGFGLSWPNASTQVACLSGSPTGVGSAVLSGNVVTITWGSLLPFNPLTAGWQVGDSVVVAVYSGADTFFNGTFTLTGVTNTTITYALTHANGTSTTLGQVNDTNVGPFTNANTTGRVGYGTNCGSGVLSCVASTATRPLGAITRVNQTTINVTGNSTAVMNNGSGQFWWFTDDRAKWGPGTVAGTVQNALENAQGCVAIMNPAGVSPIPFGLFNASNPSCGQTTSLTGNLLSNTDIGNVVFGQGMGNTIFLLPPDSDFTKCTGGGSTICLWAAISGGGNFTIHGGGNGLPAGGPHTAILWQPNQNASFFDNISLTEFASGDTGTVVGAQFVFANKYEGIYVDQFGSFPCSLSGQNVILSYYSCGDSRQVPMTIQGSSTIAHTNNGYIQATNGTEGVDVGAGASNVTWYSAQDQSYGAVNGGGTHIYIEPGSIAHVEQWSNLSGSNFGFQLGNTAKLYLRDSFVNGTTHCLGTNGVALTTGAYFDQGGNVCNGGAIESTLVPSCTFSTGGGTTPSCALQAGSTNEKGVIIATTGTGAPGSSGTITLTFAGTYTGSSISAPPCTYTIDNSGTAWGAEALVQINTQSTTAPTIAWVNIAAIALAPLAVSSPYRIDYTCIAR